MLRVTLSNKELFNCQQAANFRSMLARASGVTNQRKDPTRTDQELDLVGIKGELAVSKAYQTDFNVFEFGVDAGIDMFIGEVALDVKTTKHVSGVLLFKTVESFKAPIAVLCVEIDQNTMGIAGWINRKDFAAKCCEFINPKIKNKTGSVCVNQDQLQSPESLWLKTTELRLANG